MRAHPSHTTANHKAIEATERQRKAIELRKSGVGFQKIADTLGYKDHTGAYRAVKAGLKKTLQEPADELRAMEVERLDQMLLGLWPKATKGDTWSVDRVLRIMERRAALLGLDAPQKREVTTDVVLRGFAERAAVHAGLDPQMVLAEAERILAEVE
jgi:hypothetical protein